MFRLCFSLLTKCCVGCDGGVENGEDIGSDCDDDDGDIRMYHLSRCFVKS